MTTNARELAGVSDRDLLAVVRRLVADERHATARLIASLAELDVRRLYLAEGCSSMFTYCTRVLHLSEHAAYLRIEAARAVRKHPVLLERLDAGDITLTTIGLLAPHLTPGNHQRLVEAARHKSKREVEQLVAARYPQPVVVSAIRKLPRPARQERGDATGVASAALPLSAAATIAPVVSTVSPVAAMTMSPSAGESPRVAPATKPSIVKPLDAERYRVQFTVTRDTFDKLRRVQDLMRHTCADGDLAVVFDRALTKLLEHVERTTLARVSRPRRPQGAPAGSRHIPAAVRRAVWTRDEGRCAFVGARGRCTERGFLEFHHVVPFADGGAATVENIQLACRAHNQYESDQWFGGGSLLVRECREQAGWTAARSRPSCCGTPSSECISTGQSSLGDLIRTYPPLPRYAAPSAVLCRSV
jgi:5-methylcytosine-specific restriction endonuclease McrA